MNFFLAKQPIFDKNQKVFGYEILHDTCGHHTVPAISADQATVEVINSSLLIIGLEALTRGKKAFINFSKTLLETETALLLPNDLVVVEIDFSDSDLNNLSACRKLKERGYSLSLNILSYQKEIAPLLDVVDIVKVSFAHTTFKERKAILKNIIKEDIKFLADKVETRDDLTQALKMGYTYFQGSVFSKPVVVTGRDIVSFKPTFLLLLQEVYQNDIDFDKVEKLIKQDVSLSYKLLKYINSINYGFRAEIRSIRQALVILGRKGLIQWISLISLRSLSNNKPEELLFSALYRAKFAEVIAMHTVLKDLSSDLFLMGLFSHIDALLDQPLHSILKDLPLSLDIKDALLGEDTPYRRVYDLILNYEQGNWDKVVTDALMLNLKENELIYFYLDSLKYANTVYLGQFS